MNFRSNTCFFCCCLLFFVSTNLSHAQRRETPSPHRDHVITPQTPKPSIAFSSVQKKTLDSWLTSLKLKLHVDYAKKIPLKRASQSNQFAYGQVNFQSSEISNRLKNKNNIGQRSCLPLKGIIDFLAPLPFPYDTAQQ